MHSTPKKCAEMYLNADGVLNFKSFSFLFDSLFLRSNVPLSVVISFGKNVVRDFTHSIRKHSTPLACGYNF